VVGVVSASSPAGRRLLAGETVHVIAGMETKNADATVVALNTETVFTLLAPAGITVVPGSVKAGLGAPVVPGPAVEAAAPATDSATPTDRVAATETDASSDAAPTDSSSSGGVSSIGPIIGGVVGCLAAAAIIAAVVVVVSRSSGASTCTASVSAPTTAKSTQRLTALTANLICLANELTPRCPLPWYADHSPPQGRRCCHGDN
jgi:hypothetical protein